MYSSSLSHTSKSVLRYNPGARTSSLSTLATPNNPATVANSRPYAPSPLLAILGTTKVTLDLEPRPGSQSSTRLTVNETHPKLPRGNRLCLYTVIPRNSGRGVISYMHPALLFTKSSPASRVTKKAVNGGASYLRLGM